MHEAQMHEANCFLTLTYDDDHLPRDQSLKIAHWQLFAKKLRHEVGPFRFYHCGEYGTDNWRPHYHASIFGLDFTADRVFHKYTEQGDALYTSATLSRLWEHGFHEIGELTYETAAYVARYIMKKVNGERAESHYQWVDGETGEIHQLKPEYTTMSRRPGIGTSWFKKYHTEVYPRDEVVINGKLERPPKFYDQLYEKRNPKGYAILKARRTKEQAENASENTTERLITRETVKKAQMKTVKRTL